MPKLKGLLQYSFVLILALGLYSCKKDDVVTIPGNVAPPDPTISNSTKEGYISKVYISVLGREPDSAEFSNGYSLLDRNNFSLTDRYEFLDSVFANAVYNERVYQIARVNLLNNLDTNDITMYINLFSSFLTDTAYQYQWELLNYEINRLDTLRMTIGDLNSGTIDIKEVYRRCTNNFFYDQINMGTENFVVSMFQHFLFRYPTTAELDQGKAMVDGQQSVFFYNLGKSKNDFLRIFLNSTDYYEGQVRELYVRYLFREPNSDEMNQYTIQYKNSNDYKALQKSILSLDEYVGI